METSQVLLGLACFSCDMNFLSITYLFLSISYLPTYLSTHLPT